MPRFYESHPWRAVAAVVVLLAAAWPLTGAPTPWKIVSDLLSSQLPASNTMIVLDRSSGMARPFGKDSTKLEAARDALERFTIPIKNEGLALRAFGGSCAASGRVLVDFGAEHGDDVREASAEQQPRGRANLVNAVRAAIDDFARGDRFPDGGPRRVVVFAGSVDECTGSGGARDLRDDVEHSGVDATFNFVGFKLGGEGRKRLLAFEKALGPRAKIAFATTESDVAAIEDWLGGQASDTSDCADKVDNDGDQQIDDADLECAAGNSETPQAPAGECADGADNDGDEQIDRADPECASGNTEGPQAPIGECSDAVDNDGDEHIDDADPECASGDSESSQEPVGECADGVDNDDDAQIDEADTDCVSGNTETSHEPVGDCADEVDNDRDGRIDEADPGCDVGGTEASG